MDKGQLFKIASNFTLNGEIVEIESFGGGHINDTYLVRTNSEIKYIFQRINKNVFKKPEHVVRNIERLLDHFNLKGQNALKTFPTKTGEKFVEDESGDFWRIYNFVEGAKSFEIIENKSQAYEAGIAFGTFLLHTLDLNPGDFYETIPDFHHLGKRFIKFDKVLAQNPKNRISLAKEEVDAALSHRHIAETVEKWIVTGELPIRVTHNDTKLNNALFDVKTGKWVCVIDLDTVMPGLLMYDFGDMVRTFTSPMAEDDTDYDKVKMRKEIFEELTKGYLSVLSGHIKKAETENLVLGAKYMTLIMAVRFLTDYIEGDVYYKIKYPDHNLVRAKNQFALLKSIEWQENEMNAFIAVNFGR